MVLPSMRLNQHIYTFLISPVKKIACKYVSHILLLVSMAYKIRMKPNPGFLDEFSWKYMHTYHIRDEGCTVCYDPGSLVVMRLQNFYTVFAPDKRKTIPNVRTVRLVFIFCNIYKPGHSAFLPVTPCPLRGSGMTAARGRNSAN